MSTSVSTKFIFMEKAEFEMALKKAKEDRTSFECKTDMGEMALIIPNPDEAAAMEKWLKEEKFIHKKA